MKNKKYKKLKRAIFAGASSSIVAGMLLVGSSTVFAETSDFAESSVPAYTQSTTDSGMHLMRRWNSTAKINSLANSLGLDPDEVKQELKSGKPLKQILQENGIVPNQLQKAFEGKKKTNNRHWKNKNK
ncbi:MAG: hypothetical protein ABL899_00870 [Nitrospira sp.]